MNHSNNIGNLVFNPRPSLIMHIDLNSCFATIEQQANPLLRGKPIAVAAYDTPSGCIVAPSIEAKEYGIKVGMRVKDGKRLYPSLIVLTPDPNKYRNVHLKLRKIFSIYTNDFYPKSIDEFVLNLGGYPVLRRLNMFEAAKEIKMRIKKEVGEHLTVSVGIAPNRFLAKQASNLHKPDGLDEINKNNFWEIYGGLELMDLTGIKSQNTARLNGVGIYSVLDFYNASVQKLKAAFGSISSYYWYLRLRGWEIDNVEFERKSFGNSYALPKPLVKNEELSPILTKLVEKSGKRLRSARYKAKGIHVSVSYRDGSRWHRGKSFSDPMFDSRKIYKRAFAILCQSPWQKPVRELAVSCFNLVKEESNQLSIFEDLEKRENLVEALDEINDKWGSFVITPAKMLWARKDVPDRTAFGGVKELEEFIR